MHVFFDVFVHPSMAVFYSMVNIGSGGWEAATTPPGPIVGDIIYYRTVSSVKSVISGAGIAFKEFTRIKAKELLDKGLEIGKVITDYTLTTFIKVSLLVFIASMTTLVSIRTISLLLGGEFFLYGIQEKI
jgi:hypothetical protein